MIHWGQILFQEGGSLFIRQLDYFHDYLLFICVVIMFIVIYGFFFFFFKRNSLRVYGDSHITELIWTALPLIVLFFLALPSIRLLYLIEEDKIPSVNVKVVGHQWYWRYSYYDFPGIEFDSYITPEDELLNGEFRLLEVDRRLVLPMKSEIGIFVRGADVIHSWALPSLGVKIDAIPGRRNAYRFNRGFCGVYYGQCSEICGANHSFIPIVVESVPEVHFIKWVESITE